MVTGTLPGRWAELVMVHPLPELEAAFDALGATVAVFETVDEIGAERLAPEERAQMEGMGPRRERDFAGGRVCAHAALAAVGFRAQPLLRSADRIALWPAGATGSISHSHNYCVAAAGRLAGAHIGIDAEDIGRVTPKLWNRLFTDAEQARLQQLSGDDATYASTVMFSVKEAFYKAQFPITRAWVSFRDVHVDHEPGETALTLRRATDLAALDQVAWPAQGACIERGDRVLTAVTVTAGAPVPDPR